MSLQVCSSPAALSWSSLFGDSFSESFCFCTILFDVCLFGFRSAFCRDTASRVRQFVSGKIPLKTFRPRKAVFPFCFRQTNRTRHAVSLQVCSSPAALSWSSLFGDSFSESFCFCTILFDVCLFGFRSAFCRDTASRVRQFVSGKIPLKTFRPRKAVFPFCFRQTNRTRHAVSLQVCSSPAVLSWSSLFGDSFLESFCFCTILFAPAQNRNSPRTLSLSPDFLDTSPQIRYNRGNATAYPAVNQKWERDVAR